MTETALKCFLRASSLDDKGDREGSIEAYRLCVEEIDPKYVLAWNNLGELLIDHKKDIAGAEHAFKKALEFNPKNPEVWNNLGHLLMDHKEDYAGAIVAFKKVLAIDPEYADAKYSVDYIFEVLLYDGGFP